MTYEIVCTRGPMKGRRWVVTPQGLKIGRAEGCEIQVGDVSVALYHCVVKLEGGKPIVANLASDNGVDVNGMYVGEAVLDPMDKINIGGMRLVVSASASGRGGAIVRKVVPLLILLALAGAGAYFYRNRPKSVDVTGKPKPTSESVATNRVVRIVDELIVTTNRIINIVNNIVVTNYVEEIRRSGVLVSSRVVDMPKPQVAEPDPVSEPVVEVAEILEKAGSAIPDMYCVIDLSAGPNARKYPVTYYLEPPDGGFNVDEYKTTKLVLRLIKPGSFKMCGMYDVTLTKSFFCGIFEVTQKQYKMIMGVNPSGCKGDKRPVETVSYDMIRGKGKGSKWPESSAVDDASFMGKLRARTGLEFDLPTEAQWEYACRAGTTSLYNNGGNLESDLNMIGRYKGNTDDGKGDYPSYHAAVGSYASNAWGLYDMHGNVWEWCLDCRGELTNGVVDPTGSSSGGERVRRGGSWLATARQCTEMHPARPSLLWNDNGLRLALTMPVEGVGHLIAETRIKPNSSLDRKYGPPVAKELEPDDDLPYKIVDSRIAWRCGGAYGGDEVRVIKNSNTTYEFIHLFTEAARPKTLVIPKKNRIEPRSGWFLVVGGGGASGGWRGGGGGAGGVVERKLPKLSPGTIFVYVGEGGSYYVNGRNGDDSILSIGGVTYVGIGGGKGGGYAGGSGGGCGDGKPAGIGLQAKSPSGGIGEDGQGIVGGGSGFVSGISGVTNVYAKGGVLVSRYNEGDQERSPAPANTGSGGKEKNSWYHTGCARGGGSGIVIVRYMVRLPQEKFEAEDVSVTLPARNKNCKAEVIDGVEWRYFIEKGSVVIGCHGDECADHPDFLLPAVEANALSGVVRIPSCIAGKPVKKIGKGAFQRCANVTRFIVPEGVTHCGARAFARCPQLLSVSFPTTLVWLGYGQVYRSQKVSIIGFKSLPPKSECGRCPFRGCDRHVSLSAPFGAVDEWRKWGGDGLSYLCNDGCHRLQCMASPLSGEMKRATRTHAGFIGGEFDWRAINDYKLRQDWLADKDEYVWRNFDTLQPTLSLRKVYDTCSLPPNRCVVYVSMMFFKAKVPVSFKYWVDDCAMIKVDDLVVMPFSQDRDGWLKWYHSKSPIVFENDGWHRVAIIVANHVGSGGAGDWDGYGNDIGGVFYKCGNSGKWQMFEATPDGKTFRVTREDARRAVADIERAKAKEK